MEKTEMIEKIIDHYTNGNKAQFAKLLGVKPQTISAWIARGSFDTELIYTKCSGISADWLLSGTGAMLKNERTQKESSTEKPKKPVIPKLSDEERQKPIVPQLIDRIARQGEEIGCLKTRIAALEKIINDAKTSQSIDKTATDKSD